MSLALFNTYFNYSIIALHFGMFIARNQSSIWVLLEIIRAVSLCLNGSDHIQLQTYFTSSCFGFFTLN